MAEKDHYQTLEVRRDESVAGIRKAFRRRAKECHPDCVGPDGTTLFQEIAEAHEVLSDPARRREYDDALSRHERCPSPSVRQEPSRWPADRSRRPRAEPLTADPWPRPSPRESWGPPRWPESPTVVRLELRISPLQAHTGGIVSLSLRLTEPCPLCRGAAIAFFPCRLCGGRGSVAVASPLAVEIPGRLIDGDLVRARLDRSPSDVELEIFIRVG